VDKRFYTPAEVAELLEISSATVLRLIHDGKLPAVRVSDRIYRIPIPAFERYVSRAQDRAVAVRVRKVRGMRRLGTGEELPKPAALEPTAG